MDGNGFKHIGFERILSSLLFNTGGAQLDQEAASSMSKGSWLNLIQKANVSTWFYSYNFGLENYVLPSTVF